VVSILQHARLTEAVSRGVSFVRPWFVRHRLLQPVRDFGALQRLSSAGQSYPSEGPPTREVDDFQGFAVGFPVITPEHWHFALPYDNCDSTE
jgi:hypothetical protein